MAISQNFTPSSPMSVLKRAWLQNRPLTFLGIAMLISLAITIVGIFVDPRIITGQPAWLKPAKFSISIAIYSFTFLWLLTFLENNPRLVRWLSWITLSAFVIEVLAIVGQAARGVSSHFNNTTTFDTLVFRAMAIAIVAVWLCCLALGFLLTFRDLGDRAFAWSLRLGVLVACVGMGVAYLMTTPTAEQLTAADLSGDMPVKGAHAVGAADDGPGLPIVGWSTEGGDLRIAHFIGLHAMQVLPLLGFMLTRPAAKRRVHPTGRLLFVLIASAAYLGLTLLLTWQALRGQSIIAPDALTLTAAGSLMGILLLATVATWFGFRR